MTGNGYKSNTYVYNSNDQKFIRIMILCLISTCYVVEIHLPDNYDGICCGEFHQQFVIFIRDICHVKLKDSNKTQTRPTRIAEIINDPKVLTFQDKSKN